MIWHKKLHSNPSTIDEIRVVSGDLLGIQCDCLQSLYDVFVGIFYTSEHCTTQNCSPGVSSRPYTVALKHHKWVQEEIKTLERAGIIAKSMSPWASPIVIVSKKSQPGEPPKKRLCIDFRKINDVQQKGITEGKSKGCLSLILLPKIDEMYAKLKGAKFFSTTD